MRKNSSLLTLDRLRLAVSRVHTAKNRTFTVDDTVDSAHRAAIRRDVIGLR